MFSGIIEATGIITEIRSEGSNLRFIIASRLAPELQIDQSISHNGVCLTVIAHDQESHQVVAIRETLSKTTLGTWKPGDTVNLERSITPATLLDGHLVQGHVDAVGICTSLLAQNGSWEFTFQFPSEFAGLLVQKGSVSIDGTSLTVIDPGLDNFRVAIIPYTYEHTRMGRIEPGDSVNLEFDVIGKYFLRQLEVEGWREKLRQV
ncbi:MAG: riboflavin synthase [Saprospiraceae bacterium]|nr:riboflavin synthase [Saprospiraceae bacterium]MCB9321244.1 riboflavin synthase [Lewinellaceae bacterium]